MTNPSADEYDIKDHIEYTMSCSLQLYINSACCVRNTSDTNSQATPKLFAYWHKVYEQGLGWGALIFITKHPSNNNPKMVPD